MKLFRRDCWKGGYVVKLFMKDWKGGYETGKVVMKLFRRIAGRIAGKL